MILESIMNNSQLQDYFSYVVQGGVGHEVEEGDLGPSSEEPEEGEGGYPRTDSTYSIDIPNSVTLWEVDPRPNNSSQVLILYLFICQHL